MESPTDAGLDDGLRSCAISVGGNLTAHEITVNQTINNVPPTRKLPENILFNVKDPIETFTGRVDFLGRLKRAIEENRTQNSSQPGVESEKYLTVLSQAEVVSGLGGIGKTETVRKYILQCKDEYNHVIWIDADNRETTKQSFFRLATEKLALSVKDSENKERPLKAVIEEIYSEISKLKALVIFDNAEAYENDEHESDGIKDFLPDSLPSGHIPPSILVTSRNQDWEQKTILLEMLTEGESVAFTLEQLLDENAVEAVKLFEICGGLPLALQQAVSLIKEQSKRHRTLGKPKYGISNFVADYNESASKEKFLKHRPKNSKNASFDSTVFTIWNVTLEKIKQQEHGELAITFLNTMAFLSPTKIPKHLLLALFPHESEDDIFEALQLLLKYTLVQCYETHFAVHRMIQVVIREQLHIHSHKDDQVILNLVRSLKQVLSTLTSSLEHLDNQDILHNADVFVSNTLLKIVDRSRISLEPDILSFVETVGWEMREVNPSRAIQIFRWLTKEMEKSDVEVTDEVILRCKNSLAHILDDQGEPKEGMQVLEKSLSDFSEKLGDTHPLILSCKHTTGIILVTLGKYTDAVTTLKEVLKSRENVLGPTNKETLETKFVLGSTLRLEGLYSESKSILSEVLLAMEAPDSVNKEILKVKQQYAFTLYCLGQYDEACTIYSAILKAQEKMLDPQHPNVLISKHSLCLALNGMGKSDEAVEIYQEVLRAWEKSAGPKSPNPNALDAKHGFAYTLHVQGKYAEAADVYRDILAIREASSGPSHPSVLNIKGSLAHVLSAGGNYNEALKIQREVLKTREETLGPDDPSVLGTIHDLARTLQDKEDHREAIRIYTNYLEGNKSGLDPQHVNTLTLKRYLAQALHSQGNLDEAFTMYTQILQVQEQVLHLSHKDENVLTTKHLLAKTLNAQGLYEDASEIFCDILEKYEELLGRDDEKVLIIKHDIATVLSAEKRHVEAGGMFLKIVEQQERNLGAAHPTTLITKSYLAQELRAQGRFEEALQIYTAVLRAREQNSSPDHPEILRAKHSLAYTFKLQGKFEEAASMYTTVIEAREKALGSENKIVLDLKRFREECWQATKDTQMAGKSNKN